ncbi:MRN complex-interacting protein isoform X5 [Cavia porcellus]|uniref:MRN complex-interacting protein isoform X5 n=1 Tax=Cavia porcellus TaxID=10141 RepID=UPI002FDF758C
MAPPQQSRVLRCCSCRLFQAHQVKRSLQWTCKACGEKQSLLRTYGEGSGADCRRHVQKLNLLQGQASELSLRSPEDAEGPTGPGPTGGSSSLQLSFCFPGPPHLLPTTRRGPALGEPLAEVPGQGSQRTQPRAARPTMWPDPPQQKETKHKTASMQPPCPGLGKHQGHLGITGHTPQALQHQQTCSSPGGAAKCGPIF